MTTEQIASLPIGHLSYSAIRTLMSDPYRFKRQYIEKIWEDKISYSMAEGKAVHEVLAKYWRTAAENNPKKMTEFNWDRVTRMAIYDHLQSPDEQGKIDWLKTGCFSKSVKTVSKVIDMYLKELPAYSPVYVENTFLNFFHSLDGTKQDIPLKGVIDLVAYNSSKELVIVDHKVVSRYSDTSKPDYELQAVMYHLLIKSQLKKEIKHVVFDEIKKTANRDGSKQVISYVVKIDKKKIKTFEEIYSRVINILSGKFEFLPNPFGYDDQSWKWFNEDLLAK